MFKKYTFWIAIASILQIVTAGVHALSFIYERTPKNETEKQIYDLLTSYRPDLGPHFHPTMGDIFNGLSACFSLLYLLGGWMNLYLLTKKIPQETMKGITGINTLIFGICFLIMMLQAFLPPIICTASVFVTLCFAYATNHIHHIKLSEN